MLFLLHYLRSTDGFYDIGANVGAYTILASAVKRCKSKSFEPLPDTFERLIDQIKINRIEELVDAGNCGIGGKSETLEFTNTLNCMNRVNTDLNNVNVTKVPVVSLDSEFTPAQNTLVKIDVEGYEKFVFDGGMKLFASQNVNALIVELNGSCNQFGVTDSETHEIISSFGFVPINYNPMLRQITRTSSFNDDGNTIYVKDVSFAEERCVSSPKVLVRTAADINL